MTLNYSGYDLISWARMNAPMNPGVYCFFLNNLPLYIGRSGYLRRRMYDYSPPKRNYVKIANKVTFFTASKELTKAIESKLIDKYEPLYNKSVPNTSLQDSALPVQHIATQLQLEQ